MNKNKRMASGLILAGVSLASVAGQAATNVSAEGGIFGSIKNFFAGDRSLKAQKDKAVELRNKAKVGPSLDEKYKVALVALYAVNGILASCLISSNPIIIGGGIIALSLFTGIYGGYKFSDKYRSDASKAAENISNNLKDKIKEDMLDKQYTLKEFEDMVKDDKQCSEFIRQLLVLERDTEEDRTEKSETNNKGCSIFNAEYRFFYNDSELEETKKILKILFLDTKGIDKIKNLKNRFIKEKIISNFVFVNSIESSGKTEKFLKVIETLYHWAQGKMPSLFSKKEHFDIQKNDELHSKIVLLMNGLSDSKSLRIKSLDANGFINFICNDNNTEEATYKKEYLKSSFVLGIRDNLEKSNLYVKSVTDNLLLDSVGTLFGDLNSENAGKLDGIKKEENSKASLLDSVVEKYYSKFEEFENPKEMSMAVLDAIETWIKEKVTNYTDSLFNRDGKKESFEDRINAVRSRLENVGQEKV